MRASGWKHGLSRRTLLASAAAPLLAAPAADQPFYALCMDMQDEKKRTLADQALMLRDLGYAGAGHVWLDKVAERLATLEQERLKLFQIYMLVDVGPKARAPFDARLHEVLPLLQGRGTQLALLMVGGSPSDEALDARGVAVIREIAGEAARHRVNLVLYPHQKHWLETVQDALRLARKAECKNVGAMFNLCHWLKAGKEADAAPLLREAMPHLHAVSINGTDRRDEIRSGTGNWIQPLDSGTFDMAGFLTTLRHSGYRGPIGLQCYGIPGDAAVHLRRSMSAWRKLTRS